MVSFPLSLLFLLCDTQCGAPSLTPGCVSGVFQAMVSAIEFVQAGKHDPHVAHARVRGMYDWTRIAARTEKVYRTVLSMPERSLWERMVRCVPRLQYPRHRIGQVR